MKKLIFFLILLCVYQVSWAATYTVTQSGSGVDYSVSSFNALTGTGYAGDTFYFSGTITSEITPQISGTTGSSVTLDGYEAGACTMVNGDWPAACDSSSAKIDHTGGSTYGIRLNNVNQYVEIVDFEIQDTQIGISCYNDGYSIGIKRNYIHSSSALNGSRGIYATWTDGECDNITIGGSAADGNIIEDIGIDTGCSAIEIYGDYLTHSTGVVVSHNHIFADRMDRGIDGVTLIRVDNFLIEYNEIHGLNDYTSSGGDAENAIDIKGGCYNGIIRFNDIYNNLSTSEPAVLIQTGDGLGQDTHNIYVYGNYIHDNTFGFATYPRYIDSIAQGEVYNIYVMANVFEGNKYNGVSTIKDAGADPFYNVFILGNTLSGNSFDHNDLYGDPVAIGSDQTAIRLTWLSSSSTGVNVKNNIVDDNRTSESDYRQMYFENSSYVTADDNHYYDPDGAATIRDGSTDVVPTTLDTNGTISDPDLTATWQLSAGSPAIDAGTDLGSGTIDTLTIQGTNYPVYWDFALGPNTSFPSTGPDNIIIDTESRDSIGWDRGAYGYLEGGADSTDPVVAITTADPQNISTDSLSITFTCTDVNGISSAKWRLNAAPDAGNGTVVSGSSPFTVITSGYSDGGSDLVYAGCDDPTGNWGSDSITVNYDSDPIPPDGDGVTVNVVTHAIVNVTARGRNGIGYTYTP